MKHVHFKAWTDWETPAGPSLEAFQQVVLDGMKFVETNCRQKKEKLVVHCRAGIGRTGTTIALINACLFLHKSSEKLSVFSIVRRLREQRILMCQTQNQYEYIYFFLKSLDLKKLAPV